MPGGPCAVSAGGPGHPPGRLLLSIPLRQCGESGPPAPPAPTMKTLGCVCTGAQGTMGKGPDASLCFLPPDNVPAWPGD